MKSTMMMMMIGWYIVLITFIILHCNKANEQISFLYENDIKMATFNIQTFGQTKVAKTLVFEQICEILIKYDLIAIQEVRDSSENAVKQLLSSINKKVDSSMQYNMVISSRLGRTSSKEQYLFFYRMNMIKFIESYQYENGIEFERPPFTAKFQLINDRTLTVTNVHLTPKNVSTEMTYLYSAHKIIRSKLPADVHFIVGDFNADCTYLRAKQLSELELKSSGEYHWFVGNCIQSTMVNTNCVYDHILMYDPPNNSTISTWIHKLKSQTSRVYRYHLENSLEMEMASNVSDHLPVELNLPGEAKSDLSQAFIEPELTIRYGARQPQLIQQQLFQEKCQLGTHVTWALRGWQTFYDETLGLYGIQRKVVNKMEAMKQLNNFIENFPNLIYEEHVNLIQLAIGNMENSFADLSGTWIKIVCDENNHNLQGCSVVYKMSALLE